MIAQANPKVTADHLHRKAYLYVRQSTLQQVRRHREADRPLRVLPRRH